MLIIIIVLFIIFLESRINWPVLEAHEIILVKHKRNDTKFFIKYLLFIIINCHIYVNHIR